MKMILALAASHALLAWFFGFIATRDHDLMCGTFAVIFALSALGWIILVAVGKREDAHRAQH